jgi:hypothetical protein
VLPHPHQLTRMEGTPMKKRTDVEFYDNRGILIGRGNCPQWIAKTRAVTHKWPAPVTERTVTFHIVGKRTPCTWCHTTLH